MQRICARTRSGSILLMSWAGLRFADTQRTCPSSLLPDPHVPRGECWRTKVSRSGQAVGALAFGFSGRLPSWGSGHVYFIALCNWHSQIVDFGGTESGQRQSYPTHGPPQQVCSGGRKPNAFQQSNDVSPASPPGSEDANRSSPALHAAQFLSHHAQHRKAGRCTRTPQG